MPWLSSPRNGIEFVLLITSSVFDEMTLKMKFLQMLDKALNFVFAVYEVDRMFRRATVRDSTCKIKNHSK